MTARAFALESVQGAAQRVHAGMYREHAVDPWSDERIGARVRIDAPLLTDAEVVAATRAVRCWLDGLGPLEPLLADPEVSEVMLNGTGEVWVERHGHLEPTGTVLDRPTAAALVEKIVGPLGVRVDRRQPMADARLTDGSRVNIVVPPLAVDGPCVTIRRFVARQLPLEAFGPAPVVELLQRIVTDRDNVVVSGATGAGKTSLLGALVGTVPSNERVVSIEDTAELTVDHGHLVRLEARVANAEGVGEVRIRDLVRNALRMRPDRLVVGEVRGAEALDMIQALSTGHYGSLSTCHANSPLDALRRLETLASMAEVDLPLMAIREQLATAVQVVVHVCRGVGGQRRVVAVERVAGVDPQSGTAHMTTLVRRGQVLP